MKGKVGEQWKKIFMEIFRSMSHGFSLLSPVSLTELCSFWYGLKKGPGSARAVTGGSGANGSGA